MGNLNFNNFNNLQELIIFPNFGQEKGLWNMLMNIYTSKKSGFDEKCLQNLINLKKLDLTYFVNDYPYSFTGEYLLNLKNLTELKLYNINIEEKYLQELTQLKSLSLNFCKSIKNIDFLNNLVNLTSLTLYCIKIENNIINLQNLQNLQQLYLVGLYLHNIEVKFPSNIIELDVMDTEIEDTYIQNLQNNLKSLYISYHFNIVNNCLQNFINLTTLTVDNTINENLSFLKYLINLKQLQLKSCGILNFDKNLQSLQFLHINRCLDLTDKGLKHLINLKRVIICNCKKLNGSCLKYFTKLQYLTTDIAILDIHLKNCKSLIKFAFINYNNLQECESFTDFKIKGYNNINNTWIIGANEKKKLLPPVNCSLTEE
ncbi:hypothetical protein ABK040_002263 [Willaertia magna]